MGRCSGPGPVADCLAEHSILKPSWESGSENVLVLVVRVVRVVRVVLLVLVADQAGLGGYSCSPAVYNHFLDG